AAAAIGLAGAFAGMGAAGVLAFIDKLFQIPDTIPPTKIEADTAAAEATVASFALMVERSSASSAAAFPAVASAAASFDAVNAVSDAVAFSFAAVRRFS
ncbi:hypothetical protein ACC691_38120, partial [Rhizobium johnstonii]|uniref:hypothetical protein n=1 Tax=Rhizobium johnstonii TaxID=3019933 RepID=UPI003F9741EA